MLWWGAGGWCLVEQLAEKRLPVFRVGEGYRGGVVGSVVVAGPAYRPAVVRVVDRTTLGYGDDVVDF